MPQVAGVAVAGWFGSAAAGAIASAVVTGAIVGAVIGAATAVMSGGDIFQGALKGALIGGISGGVLKGASLYAGWSTPGKAFVDAAGGAAPSATAPTVAANVPQGELLNAGGAKAALSDPNLIPAGQSPSGILSGTPPPVEKASSILNSPAVAGATEGFGTGVALAGGQLMDTKAEEDIEEMRQRQEEQVRSQNVPGEFESKTANITPPNWWDKHLNPNLA